MVTISSGRVYSDFLLDLFHVHNRLGQYFYNTEQ